MKLRSFVVEVRLRCTAVADQVDVTVVEDLVDADAGRVLLAEEIVTLYESVQEFLVGELDGEVVGCRGAPRPVGGPRRDPHRRRAPAGVAEFLDLAHVKPNTLGNVRMLLHL